MTSQKTKLPAPTAQNSGGANFFITNFRQELLSKAYSGERLGGPPEERFGGSSFGLGPREKPGEILLGLKGNSDPKNLRRMKSTGKKQLNIF